MGAFPQIGGRYWYEKHDGCFIYYDEEGAMSGGLWCIVTPDPAITASSLHGSCMAYMADQDGDSPPAQGWKMAYRDAIYAPAPTTSTIRPPPPRPTRQHSRATDILGGLGTSEYPDLD